MQAKCLRLVSEGPAPDATVFKTKKAAREAGYLSDSDMYAKALAPKRDAVPITIKGETFYADEQREE